MASNTGTNSKLLTCSIINRMIRFTLKCDWKVVNLNSTSNFNVLSLQNDLIHGWGLDMKLGYCAQVLKLIIQYHGGLLYEA